MKKFTKKVLLAVLTVFLVASIIGCGNPSSESEPDTGNGGDSGGETQIPAVTLTSITANGTLETALYYIGDGLDTSVLTVTATYSDGSSKTVTGFSAIPFSEVNIGTEQNVTISYTENGVTKTTQVKGTFYVAASDARPTETPIDLGGNIYKFGDFPQTVSTLTGDTAYTGEPICNGWYLGSDGYFYAKCTENAYEDGYKYSNNTTVAQSSANSEKYFKVEPIKWRVLTTDYNGTGKKLLLAKNTLTAKVPYYGGTFNRTLKGKDICANNYKYSNIRAYLNGTKNQFVTDGGTATANDIDWSGKGFIDIAFTESAQSYITESSIDNSKESTTDAGNNLPMAENYYCDDTTDKIFLLSELEVTKTEYGFAVYNSDVNSNRDLVPTDYAMANYAFLRDGSGYWWLRSPSNTNYDKARFVNDFKYAKNDNNVNFGVIGVVPALCLN